MSDDTVPPLRRDSNERARTVTPENLKWMWARSRNTGQVLHGHPWDAQLWSDLTESVNTLLTALAAEKEARRIAEQRNLLNPSATDETRLEDPEP